MKTLNVCMCERVERKQRTKIANVVAYSMLLFSVFNSLNTTKKKKNGLRNVMQQQKQKTKLNTQEIQQEIFTE